MVSVIIPNYNHSLYLQQRIESVLAQTFPDFELIIMDDCSADDSKTVIEQYRNHPKVSRIVYNEQNSGTTFRQWNKGIALARGKYIWIAESDDYADPRFLETLVARLEENPDAGLAWCESWRVDEAGKPHGTWAPVYEQLDKALWSRDFVMEGRELVRRFMAGINIIPNASAVLMRRTALEAAGPAPENMRVAGDWIFWIRFLAATRAAFITQPLNFFRFHQRNVRSATEMNGIMLLERAQVLRFVKTVVEPEEKLYRQTVDNFMEQWLHALAYSRIPWKRHQAFFREMEAVQPGFGRRMRKRFVQYLFQNRLSGMRILLKDGFIRKLGS